MERYGPEKVDKDLSDITCLPTFKFDGFPTSPRNCLKSHVLAEVWKMSSFGETKVDKLIQTDAPDFVEFTRVHMARTYPKGIILHQVTPSGTRVDSSNYDPMTGWVCGLQMAALNFQTSSEPMWYNDALFQDNGSCGYVLKPLCMLTGKFDPNKKDRLKESSKYRSLTVEVRLLVH